MIDEQIIRECKEGAAQCLENARQMRFAAVCFSGVLSVIIVAVCSTAIYEAYQEKMDALLFVGWAFVMAFGVRKILVFSNESSKRFLQLRQEFLDILDP